MTMAATRLLLCALLFLSADAFQPRISSNHPGRKTISRIVDHRRLSAGAPSDYDPDAVLSGERSLSVATAEEDDQIREDLKKELMMLASITNRGEYTSKEERDIVIDLVTQLEALNPTPNPAMGASDGDWDLCLSSTQFFRSSPFFLSIQAAMSNMQMSDNFFDIHDRATTVSRIGRVRQRVGPSSLVSEVDLEVGLLPGFPFRVKGTVVTRATKAVVGAGEWELRIETTQVKGSNVPIFNQFLDDLQFELPVGEIYTNLMQEVPPVKLTTYYVDDGIRITRDSEDNFYVFTRA